MDKYEYKLKTEQMLELMEDGAYSRAAELADSIDWRRVRNTTMLMNVSDIYEKSRDYHKSFEVLKIAYHRAEGSRKIVYRLCTLALKTRNVDEAIDYYDEFLHIAPKDPNQYILKYQILKVQRAPIEQQIDALESFKKAEYVEEWAYELAKLYERAGKITECLEECDDLILWFSEGKYVYQAMELKMRYKPLTPSQQEKYNRRYEKPGTTTEELPNLNNVDENGVKVAAKSVTSTQEQTEEDAAKTEDKAESDKSAESEPDIKIPIVEETLANKFVDEDVVKAEVRAKAKAEILGEADSFEPTSIDSLTEAIRKAAETETAEQETPVEKEEQESEEIAERTESSEEVKEQKEEALDQKEDSVEVETEQEVEKKQSEKKKIGNTMRLDEALKALLHIGGSDDTSKENSDEEAEKKEEDLSDLNDAIEDIEDVVDLSLVQKVEQKRAQRKALEAVKDVKVDSDLEELSMKKLKSKPETTVNLDDTLPMNLDDTVEMSPEEIIAMYGGTEETIEEEPEAEEIIEPEEEEIIEEEPEAEEVIEPEEEEIIEEEPEAEEIIEPEEEEIIEEEPEAEEVIEPEYVEEETIDEDEIFEVEQVLEAKYIEPEDEEEDQLDNQVTARMSLEELFAAWDEEDALAEAEEFEEAEAEEVIEPEVEEIIEEEPEAEEIIEEEPEAEEIIEEEPEAEEIIEPEAEEIIEEEPEAEEIIEPEVEEIIEEEPEAEEVIEEEPEAEETEEISEEDILNLDSAEEWSDDEIVDAVEENSDNKAESVEEIDEVLNEAESVKDIKQAEPEKEETMSVERKTGEPILPPDIQRLIDEIEGVIPREDEEPMSESSTSASKIQERMPEDNMEQEMDMLRVDDSDEYEDEYEDEYADELPVEEEESLEAVQPQGGYTQEFERIMDDRFASFEAEEDYSDELGDLYPDMEDDISDEVDAIALEEEAFEQETEIDSPEYEDEEYPEEEYEDEYEDEEYPEEEYEDEYEDEEYPEEEYEDEYEDEEYPEEEYEDEYEDDEYPEEEYEDEYEDEEYPEEEYEDEYEDEEYPEEEYEDEYEDEEYPEEEYEDEYEDEEYPEEEYEDEYDGAYEYEDDEEYCAADAAAQFEAEFRPQSSNDEYDDRLIEDEDDDTGVNFLSKTAPLSRKETAKLIATGKTAPLPLDEISNALSISDTGFLVHNRHELLSESGKKKTELTADQKRLFSYFVPVRGMSEQLVDVLEQDKNCTNRRGTSRTGNLLIIGNKGNGKTVLAVDVVKAIQRQRNIHQGKVAIVTGESLNKKKIGEIFRKLYGGALIIEKAGKLNERTVAKLNKVMEQDTGELLIVLEDQRKPLDRLLSSNREFRKKFTSRLEVPIFINDELVTFGQTYAQENGYRIDEMGLLALYSRIDALQREDHFVTVAEVKEIMDEAMEHSKKASARKLVKRVFGKGTDDADRILLTEKDFHI